MARNLTRPTTNTPEQQHVTMSRSAVAPTGRNATKNDENIVNLHCCRLGLLVFDLPPFSFGAPRCQPSSFLRWGCSLSMSLGFPLRLPVVDRPPFQLGLLAVDLPPFPAEPPRVNLPPSQSGLRIVDLAHVPLWGSSLSPFLLLAWQLLAVTLPPFQLGLLVVDRPPFMVGASRCHRSLLFD